VRLRSILKLFVVVPVALLTMTSAASAQNFKKLADLHSAYVQLRMDTRFLYFPDGDFLARVPKEGGEVEQAGRLGQSCQGYGSVAAQADGYNYWAGGNTVQRCSASGGKPEVLAQVPEYVRYFALTPTKIAWVTDGFNRPGGGLIQVMPRSGGEVTTLVSGLKTSNYGGMVSDGDKLFWIESNTGNVMRGSTDAKGFTILCMACGGNDLLQDKDHLYSRHENSIVEVSKETSKAHASSLAKGTFRELYKGPVTGALAVDGEFIYFAAWDKQGQRSGRIMRVSRTTKKTVTLVTQLNKPVQVLVDDANVYFIDDEGSSAIIGSIKKP
jgi:hypothetical protein